MGVVFAKAGDELPVLDESGEVALVIDALMLLPGKYYLMWGLISSRRANCMTVCAILCRSQCGSMCTTSLDRAHLHIIGRDKESCTVF